MTESAPALNDPFAVLTGPLAATTRMQLEVVESAPLGPGMQRLVLTAPELAGLQYQPGQDMMLMVADHVEREQPPRMVERPDRVAPAYRPVAVHRHHEHHVLAGLVLQPGQLRRGQHEPLHAGAQRRGVDHP